MCTGRVVNHQAASVLYVGLVMGGGILAQAQSVTIIRDHYGVPHVFADSPHAAARPCLRGRGGAGSRAASLSAKGSSSTKKTGELNV